MTGLLLSDTTVISGRLVRLTLGGLLGDLVSTVIFWANTYGQDY